MDANMLFCFYCNTNKNKDDFFRSTYTSVFPINLCIECNEGNLKRCGRCKEYLELSKFNKCNGRFKGVNANCKECTKDYTRERIECTKCNKSLSRDSMKHHKKICPNKDS